MAARRHDDGWGCPSGRGPAAVLWRAACRSRLRLAAWLGARAGEHSGAERHSAGAAPLINRDGTLALAVAGAPGRAAGGPVPRF